MFSNHDRMKLEISNRKKTGKFRNMWELTNGTKKRNHRKLENTLR